MTAEMTTSNGDGRLSPATRRALWLADPLFILVMCAPPFAIALLLTEGGRSYPSAIGAIALVVRPIVGDFFEVAAVIATVLVAVAAATNFGRRAADLDERLRTVILIAVVVGVLTVVGLASCAVVVAFDDPLRWPTATLILAVTWVCLLVSHVVFGEASREERARTAEAQVQSRRQRAAAVGITHRTAVSRRRRVVVEVVFWLLPAMVWLGAASAVIVASGLSLVSGGLVFVVAGLLYFGPLLLAIAWRASADRSAPPAGRLVVRAALATIGVLAAGVFAFTMFVSPPLVPLGISYTVFCAVWGVVLFVPAVETRMPLLGTLEAGVTIDAIADADARLRRLDPGSETAAE